MRPTPILHSLILASTLISAPRLLSAQLATLGPRRTATVPDISVTDLRARVYAFADDSMRGRRVGTADALRAAEFIAREARRIGLMPAGDRGSYFQDVPFGVQMLDSASTLTVNGRNLRLGTEWVASAPIGRPPVTGTYEIVFGGDTYDTMNVVDPELVRGKMLVLRRTPLPTPLRAYQESAGYARYGAMLRAAAVRVIVAGPEIPATTLANALRPDFAYLKPDTVPTEVGAINCTAATGDLLLGAPLSSLAKGPVQRSATVDLRFRIVDRPGRNVVAVLPGADARLTGQYVALGAHMDHVDYRTGPLDHDSVRAFLTIARPQGQEARARVLTSRDSAAIRALRDSLTRAAGGPRLDSIFNGADDDASGAMGLLEIAEYRAAQRSRPRRSILFVWHTGEENGMLGAQHFTDHPTVQRDSIVAQLNVDMIGRGRAEDVTGRTKDGTLLRGRDDGYLQIIGSRRLSSQLGDIVEERNAAGPRLQLDYTLGESGHPQMLYCRSDHYMYARYGIPIVFFTTGGHRDYHQVTDEPQYLHYENYRRVTLLIHDVAMTIANLDARVVVDGPVAGPSAECRQ